MKAIEKAGLVTSDERQAIYSGLIKVSVLSLHCIVPQHSFIIKYA